MLFVRNPCMNNESAEQSTQSNGKSGNLKGSTNELPMLDLQTALGFLNKLDESGLQTLSQAEVAKHMGYSTNTSTPFYRRAVAAKLFGLLDNNQGMVLTRLALDYFKPTDENAKSNALRAAVQNVVAYQKILERYANKRAPTVEILANAFERDHKLKRDAARICAQAFLSSLSTAGMLDGSGSLTGPAARSEPAPSPEVTPSSPPVVASVAQPGLDASGLLETHYLTLDRKSGRKIVLQGPAVITATELSRIQSWLAVQFEVVDSLTAKEAEPGQP